MSRRYWPVLPALFLAVACKKDVPTPPTPPTPANPVRVQLEGPWRGRGTGTSAREAAMVRDVRTAVKTSFLDAGDVDVIARESSKQDRVVVLIRFSSLGAAGEKAYGGILEGVRAGLQRDLKPAEAIVIGMKGDAAYRAMAKGTTEDMLRETKSGPDVTRDLDDAIGDKL